MTTANAAKSIKFYKKRKFRDMIFVFLMLAWPIAHFCVFWIYINGRTIALTFQKLDYYGTVTGVPRSYYWIGLENYIEAFKHYFFSQANGGDPTFRTALLNSLKAFPLNNLLILPFAFVSAFILFKKIKLANFFRVVFYIPSIVSIVVLTMLYKYMFDSRFGPIYMIFEQFGYTPHWFSVINGTSNTIWPLIIIYCLWAGLGMNMILISSAMSRVPSEILESGKIDGVGFWRECFQIVLPLIWPTISTLIVFGTMGVFGFMMQPYLLAGENDQTSTIALRIFGIVTRDTSDSSAVSAATMGMLFCFLGTPFVFLIKWLTEKFNSGIEF